MCTAALTSSKRTRSPQSLHVGNFFLCTSHLMFLAMNWIMDDAIDSRTWNPIPGLCADATRKSWFQGDRLVLTAIRLITACHYANRQAGCHRQQERRVGKECRLLW